MTTEDESSTREIIAQWSRDIQAANWRVVARVAGDSPKAVDPNATLGRPFMNTVSLVRWFAHLFENGSPDAEQLSILANLQKIAQRFRDSHERTAVAHKLLCDSLAQYPALESDGMRALVAQQIAEELGPVILPPADVLDPNTGAYAERFVSLFDRQGELIALFTRFHEPKRRHGFEGSTVGLLAAINRLAGCPLGQVDASALDKAIKRIR